ncbi:MFS transporter [Enterococcus sp. LJL90]
MKNYQKTLYACFTGYIVQAILNNFIPLLFLTFRSQYGISLTQISLLISGNFLLQLAVDFAAIFFVDRIGYRFSIVLAHLFAFIGLGSLAILPNILPDPFIGLLLSVLIYAIGGGLLEVLVSPIVEACPTDNKEKAMSLLHSFYCWGYVAVVLVSTIFFAIFGIANWPILAVIWALIPLANMFIFTKVPLAPVVPEGEVSLSNRQLFGLKSFWLFLVMMVAAGASEQSISQWASTFAEQALGVSKALGDLAGPMLFAIMMGLSRLLYGKYGEKIQLNKFMQASGFLCLAAYLLVGLSGNPIFGFIGCALSGFSVGILWPGTFSLSSKYIRNGGTAMFAYLALAGDLGCSIGPALVGTVAQNSGNSLQAGILSGSIFPLMLVACVFLVGVMSRRRASVVLKKV